MNKNMNLWDQVKTTDPDMTEKINFGAFKFTTIDAQYQVMKCTEAFGPCGIGWGLKNQVFDVIEADKADSHFNLLCFTATLWYNWGGQAGELEIAADIELFEYSKKNQEWNRVGDPVKKVRTAALSKGLSWLGFNADVFLGKFDDARYVNQVQQDKRAGKLGPVQPPGAEVTKASDPIQPFKRPDQNILDDITRIAKLIDLRGEDFKQWLKDTHHTTYQKMDADVAKLVLTDLQDLAADMPADSRALGGVA